MRGIFQSLVLPVALLALCLLGACSPGVLGSRVAAGPIEPVAAVSATPAQEPGSLEVTFDAGASHDPDGTLASFDWDFDSDGTYDISDGGPTPTHTYDESGTYIATVRVTDNDGLTDTAQSNGLTVPAVPVGPVAQGSFAPDSEDPLTVTFDATLSTAPGAITRYDWDMDGDGEFELTDAGPNPSHTFTEYDTYTVTVRIHTDDGQSDTGLVQVDLSGSAPLTPPVAALSADPESGNAPDLRVTLDASGSTDADGEIVSYRWDWDSDGLFEVVTEFPVYTHTFREPGIVVVTVQVTDNDSLSAQTTAEIDLNAPPVAHLATDHEEFNAEWLASFDASGSTDTDGTIAQYDWDLDNDGIFELTAVDAVQEASYVYTGRYTVRVRVTDDDGAMSQASLELTVTEPNQPPTAVLHRSSSVAVIGQASTVDGLGSYDPDGAITAYEWDFDGDGVFNEPGAEAAAHLQPGPHQVEFAAEGEVEVGLRVSDDGLPLLNHGTSSMVTVYPTDARFELEVQVTMLDIEEFPQHSNTMVRLYHGDPEQGGIILDMFTVDHTAVPLGDPASGVFDNLPARDNYWLRLMNVFAEWDTPQSWVKVEAILDIGPITVPRDSAVEATGRQTWCFD